MVDDPIIPFKQTRNLREIISGNNIINKNIKKAMKENMNGKIHPMQRQEKHDVLETGQDHYMFHNLQKYKDF